MTMLTTFKLTAKDGDASAIAAFLTDILPDTCTYAGCSGARFATAQNSPREVLLMEEWNSMTEFEAYLNWRIERGDFAKLRALLSDDPDITHFDLA